MTTGGAAGSRWRARRRADLGAALGQSGHVLVDRRAGMPGPPWDAVMRGLRSCCRHARDSVSGNRPRFLGRHGCPISPARMAAGGQRRVRAGGGLRRPRRRAARRSACSAPMVGGGIYGLFLWVSGRPSVYLPAWARMGKLRSRWASRAARLTTPTTSTARPSTTPV